MVLSTTPPVVPSAVRLDVLLHDIDASTTMCLVVDALRHGAALALGRDRWSR